MGNPYAKRVLIERLDKENFNLVLYKTSAETIEDPLLVEWGMANANSCEKRIEDLKTAIKKLNE